MKDKPLGRDRLGCLVYEGDIVVDEGVDDEEPYSWYVWGESSICELTLKSGPFYDEVWANQVMVIFEDSPKRTNYERYFADLGTEDEIRSVIFDCEGSECGTCPFLRWGGEFHVGPWTTCYGFPAWLGREATE